MAYEQRGFCISLPAAGDLSTKQFYFMKLNSSGQVTTCAAVTDIPIGVLQNKPNAAGEPADIMVLGTTKVSGDANLAKGDQIGTSSDGQAAAYVNGTDTTKYIVGQVLWDNTTAGGLCSAVINCAAPGRGA